MTERISALHAAVVGQVWFITSEGAPSINSDSIFHILGLLNRQLNFKTKLRFPDLFLMG